MNRTLAWIAALSTTAIFVLGGCSDDSTSSAGSSSSAAAASSAVVSMKDQIPSPFTDDPQMPNTFVGSVDGTDAYIAVVTSGSAAMAFVCDGEYMWAWMDGTVDNGKLALTGADGATLQATVDGSAIAGSLSMPGTDGKAITAVAAAPGEGVYRTVMTKDGQEMTLGWIIRTEGARGLLRTSGGTNTNGVNTNRDDNDRARERRDRREEEDRCNKLARDLADAQATLAFLESQPRVGGNIQMVALNQQRVQRLIAVQC